MLVTSSQCNTFGCRVKALTHFEVVMTFDPELSDLVDALLIDLDSNDLMPVPSWFDDADKQRLSHLTQLVLNDWGYLVTDAGYWMDCFSDVIPDADWDYPATYPNERELDIELFKEVMGKLAQYRYASSLERMDGIIFLYGEERAKYHRNKDAQTGKKETAKVTLLRELYYRFLSLKPKHEHTAPYFRKYLESDDCHGDMEVSDDSNYIVFCDYGRMTYKAMQAHITQFRKNLSK
jgi:hypothetical protein